MYFSSVYFRGSISKTDSKLTHLNFYYDRSKFELVKAYKYSDHTTSTQIAYESVLESYLSQPDAALRAAWDVEDIMEFRGWYTDSECTEAFNIETMPSNAVRVYAKFAYPQVTAHFRAVIDSEKGEEEVGKATVEYGAKAKAPEDPVREYYDFLGWFYENGARYDPDQPITEDVTVYAHWKLKDITFTVHYYKANRLFPEGDRR